MTPSDRHACADAAPEVPAGADALIASLRGAGAGRFDAVRMHYVEALAKRAHEHRGSVRRMLDARLAQAVEALQQGFERARDDASAAAARCAVRAPHAAGELQALLAAGDFKGVRRSIAALEGKEQGASLGELARRLGHAPHDAGARPELKTLRDARTSWAKLSAEKQVAQALEHVPANAGPINSHMLVLRSLALMRDISPDYLHRFMSYADTLLSLDQGEKEKAGNPKKQPAAKAAKK